MFRVKANAKLLPRGQNKDALCIRGERRCKNVLPFSSMHIGTTLDAAQLLLADFTRCRVPHRGRSEVRLMLPTQVDSSTVEATPRRFKPSTTNVVDDALSHRDSEAAADVLVLSALMF
jgi:hypothetical protein